MKKFKGILALVLSLILVFSLAINCYAVPMETTTSEGVTHSTPDTSEEGTNRYYFYMPTIWKNKYSDKPGIYWWEGTDACLEWPGGKTGHESEVKDVYYYDVPKDVATIIWNNCIDGGYDKTAEIFKYADNTNNIFSEYYDPGESPRYPNGTTSFDGMIYVVDFRNFMGEIREKYTYNGEWYYYYGNGEYGLTPEKGEIYYTNSYLIEPLEIGEYAVGDVNADRSINIKDATTIQKYLAKLIEFDEGQIKRAGGYVDISCATKIQKFSAHLLTNGWDNY